MTCRWDTYCTRERRGRAAREQDRLGGAHHTRPTGSSCVQCRERCARNRQNRAIRDGRAAGEAAGAQGARTPGERWREKGEVQDVNSARKKIRSATL